MMPNKLLEAHHIPQLSKKLPASIIEVNGVTYLIIQLSEKKPGIPAFKE